MSERDPRELSARLEALERSVASLTDELSRLRAQLESDRRATDRQQLPPVTSRQSPTRFSRSTLHYSTDQVESLVGRYGMLALATLTGLAAVGTFLGWAITQGVLGPASRVALGLVVAAGLGAAGIRLRRSERSFGATLLGLALATTHLCAWAAGPLLGLVPTWGSLVLAATIAIALAGFAQRENDEPLWCVGFGGAAIAPFVASPDDGSATLLASYGLIVMLSACYALAGRHWPVASRVFAAVTALFVGALMAMPEREGGPLLAIGLPLVVGIGGVLPFVGRRAEDRERGRLRVLGVFAGAAALRAAFATQLPLSVQNVAIAIGVAGLIWIVMVDRTADAPPGDLFGGLLPNTATVAEWLDGGWIPLSFAAALVIAADTGRWGSGALAVGSGLVLAGFVARRPAGALRDAAVVAATVSILAGIVLAGQRSPHETAIAVAGAAVLFFGANRIRPSHSWLWVGGIGLVMASLSSFVWLVERPSYAYTPFATRESATAFAIAICWAIAARLSPMIPFGKARAFGVTTVAAWVWAFAWVHQELLRAFSPTAATLLLVTYYATTSAIAVGLGRARSLPGLRHVGLALGLVAAFTAMRGTRRLDSVGATIAAYLVTSVFLLGIAYWYRRRGVETG